MLQVWKVGATVLGSGMLRQRWSSRRVSVLMGSVGFPVKQSTFAGRYLRGGDDGCDIPMGTFILLLLMMIQLCVSVRKTSCARTLVRPMSEICKESRCRASSCSFSFFTISRNGMSLLHVRIAGSGSLASTLTDGALFIVGLVGELGVLLLFLEENNSFIFPFISPPPGTAMNACLCRAYTSDPVDAGRGGSMGKKLNGVYARGFSLKNDCRFTVTLT